MSIRASEAAGQAEWLQELLRGAILQDVRVPDPRSLVLVLRRPGATVRLLISAEAGRARFHTIERSPPAPKQPFAFQGLLRKELRGRVEELGLVGGDRLLRIAFSELSILAVLFGPQADLLLVDAEQQVIGSALGRHARGSTYEAPGTAGTPQTDRFAGVEGAERDSAIRDWFEKEALERRHGQLKKRLEQRLRSLRRRIAKQRPEAERGDTVDELRRQGDLLQGGFHLLRKGCESVEVPDFYEGGVRRIVLEPALEPQANISRYYRRSKRAERARVEAGRRLEQSLEELDEAESLALQLADADTLEALEALERQLPASRKSSKKRGRGPKVRLPYRAWKTESGFEIRVGRGARDNDTLTFRHSRGNDVWMHVRGKPGAHVVICRPGEAPPLELLLLGAQLVLAHSGVGEGTRAEVSWTRVKELRKVPGMAAGKVLLRSEKVLYVEADPSALEALHQA